MCDQKGLTNLPGIKFSRLHLSRDFKALHTLWSTSILKCEVLLTACTCTGPWNVNVYLRIWIPQQEFILHCNTIFIFAVLCFKNFLSRNMTGIHEHVSLTRNWPIKQLIRTIFNIYYTLFHLCKANCLYLLRCKVIEYVITICLLLGHRFYAILWLVFA